MRLHSILPLLSCSAHTLAQNCYYPNGDLSTSDYPCAPSSSTFGTCCPLNWQCLSNGLCYLENAYYFGRYTCTDQSWGSSCPGLCTYNDTAYGAEAILDCGDGTFCCDWDRISGDCCKKEATSFALATGTQIAFISATAARTSVGSGARTTSAELASYDSSTATGGFATSTTGDTLTSPTSSVSATSSISTAPSSRSLAASLETVTLISTPISPGASPTTITQISTLLLSVPTNTPIPNTPRPLAPILGPSISIPIALACCALLAFLLMRRHRKRKHPRQNPDLFNPGTAATDMYAHLPPGDPYAGAYRPELDSYPVAETKPLSELEGGAAQYYDPSKSPSAAAAMASPQSSSISPLTGTTNRWSNVSEVQQPPTQPPTQPPAWWTPGQGMQQRPHSSVHPFFKPDVQSGAMRSVPEGVEAAAPFYRAYQPLPVEPVELGGVEVPATGPGAVMGERAEELGHERKGA